MFAGWGRTQHAVLGPRRQRQQRLLVRYAKLVHERIVRVGVDAGAVHQDSQQTQARVTSDGGVVELGHADLRGRAVDRERQRLGPQAEPVAWELALQGEAGDSAGL